MLHAVIDGLQPVLGGHDPVSHVLPGHLYASSLPLFLLTVEGNGHNVLLFNDMCYCRRRSNTARESPVWFRCFDHNGSRAISVILAVAAGVNILHMLSNGKLGRHHDQLFGNLLADDMPFMAAGTGQLFLGKAVFNHGLGQAFEADTFLFLALGTLVGGHRDQLRLRSKGLCV